MSRSGAIDNGKPARNGRATASVLVGVVAVAVLPSAIAVAERTELLELIEAAGAIPLALLGGIVALVLGRRARREVERTIGRVGGAGRARVGRALGVLGICLALSGTIAVAVYALARYSQ